jgi:hypothetical protein
MKKFPFLLFKEKFRYTPFRSQLILIFSNTTDPKFTEKK